MSKPFKFIVSFTQTFLTNNAFEHNNTMAHKSTAHIFVHGVERLRDTFIEITIA